MHRYLQGGHWRRGFLCNFGAQLGLVEVGLRSLRERTSVSAPGCLGNSASVGAGMKTYVLCSHKKWISSKGVHPLAS